MCFTVWTRWLLPSTGTKWSHSRKDGVSSYVWARLFRVSGNLEWRSKSIKTQHSVETAQMSFQFEWEYENDEIALPRYIPSFDPFSNPWILSRNLKYSYYGGLYIIATSVCPSFVLISVIYSSVDTYVRSSTYRSNKYCFFLFASVKSCPVACVVVSVIGTLSDWQHITCNVYEAHKKRCRSPLSRLGQLVTASWPWKVLRVVWAGIVEVQRCICVRKSGNRW